MSSDIEVNEALQRLDRALESPRILAAKAVAEYRGERPSPKINQHDDRGGKRLDVVAVVHSSEPRHAPNVSQMPHRSWWARLIW